MGVPPSPPILPSPAPGVPSLPLSPLHSGVSAAPSSRCSDSAVPRLATSEPLLLAQMQPSGPVRLPSIASSLSSCPQAPAFPSIQGLSQPMVVRAPSSVSWMPPFSFVDPQATSSSQISAGSGGFQEVLGSSVPSLGTGDFLQSSVRPVAPVSVQILVVTASDRPPSSVGLPSVLPGDSSKPRSFAQVVGNSWRPGFVRSHAASIAGFGQLPDVPVHPSISVKEGCPAVCFSPTEAANAVAVFDRAVIMRFLSGRPSLEECHSVISASWGLSGQFSMGLLNSKSLLLRFEHDMDVITALSRESNHIKSFPFKIYRWHSRYHLREDAARAPVWISLPGLPIYCFVPSCLRSIAGSIGNFLRIDQTTATLTRPSVARVCIEVDLSKPLPNRVWIGMLDGFWQEIIYEKLPQYCVQCRIQGHNISSCRLSSHRQKSPVNFDESAMTGQKIPIRKEGCVSGAEHAAFHQVSVQQVGNLVSSGSGPDSREAGPAFPLVQPAVSLVSTSLLSTGGMAMSAAECREVVDQAPVGSSLHGGVSSGVIRKELAKQVQLGTDEEGRIESSAVDIEVGRQAILALAAQWEGVSFAKPGFLSGSGKGKKKVTVMKPNSSHKKSKLEHVAVAEEDAIILDQGDVDGARDITPSGVRSAGEEEEHRNTCGYATDGGDRSRKEGAGRRNKRHPDVPLRVRFRDRPGAAAQRI